MPSQIRTIQTDFSAGELDPLAAVNLNTNLRSIGLGSSINSIHQSSGAVSKRAPSRMIFPDDGIGSSLDSKVEMVLGDRSVVIVIPASGANAKIFTALADGSMRIDSWSSSIPHAGSKWAVYENQICEVNAKFLPYLHTLTYDASGNPQVSTTQMAASQWPYAQNPTSCCFSQGRLLLAFGSTVVASRTPEEGKPRFFDFKLSDNTYSYIIEIDHGAVKADHTAKSVVYLERDTKIPEKAGGYTYSEYLAMDGITKCVDTITDSRTAQEDSNEVGEDGTRLQQTVTKKVYVLTANFTGGIADYTDAIVKKTISTIGTRTVDLVVTEGTSSTPDIDLKASSAKGALKEPEMAPVVLPSHAVELSDNDLFASDIQWIIGFGRIVVGTKTAIFISTSDVITPADFDLTVTSYIGSSSLPAKVLNSWLIWSSFDRKKLYGAMYSNEMQGLSIIELTGNAHHMFSKGIIDYEMTDIPSQTIYALTADGSVRVCAMIARSEGYMFAWSSWTFPDAVRYMAFARAVVTSHPLMVAVKANGKSSVLAIDSREIYQYGENGYEPYADAIWQETGIISDEQAGTRCYHQVATDIHRTADSLEVILSADGIADRIFRAKADEQGRIDLGVLSSAYKNYRITLAVPYRMELELFTQIMPNNSGIALLSKHSISRIDFQLYKSNGGRIETAYNNELHILQLIYGQSIYRDSVLDEDGQPISHTGVYGIDNPTTTGTDDRIKIVSEEPYPFNLMAVAQTIRLTEVY